MTHIHMFMASAEMERCLLLRSLELPVLSNILYYYPIGRQPVTLCWLQQVRQTERRRPVTNAAGISLLHVWRITLCHSVVLIFYVAAITARLFPVWLRVDFTASSSSACTRRALLHSALAPHPPVVHTRWSCDLALPFLYKVSLVFFYIK